MLVAEALESLIGLADAELDIEYIRSKYDQGF
jgi:hypothetical protein